MKTLYRGFEIDVHKEQCLGGWQMTYFSVFTPKGFEVESGCTEDTTNVHTQMTWWKNYVDRVLLNPRDYLEEDEIRVLKEEGILPEARGEERRNITSV